MVSFYPGPSQLATNTRQYLVEIYDSGILSRNHRSSEFIKVIENMVALLKTKLQIPQDYSVFFISSATEAWEIIAQSLIKEQQTLHFFNGAFGEKWYKTTLQLTQQAIASPILFKDASTDFYVAQAQSLPHNKHKELPILCLTHCETSNGTYIPTNILQTIRHHFADWLIAIDATSSLGGIHIDFESLDVCFASVQKCLGLPAGLGLMICSPKAIAQAEHIGHRQHYNSVLNLYEMAQKNQTTHTPNMLAICLLEKILLERSFINEIHQLLVDRHTSISNFLKQNHYTCLDIDIPSPTVVAVTGTPEWIKTMKQNALSEGILLGNGYGNWKNTTFRIANFPSITNSQIDKLFSFLTLYSAKN